MHNESLIKCFTQSSITLIRYYRRNKSVSSRQDPSFLLDGKLISHNFSSKGFEQFRCDRNGERYWRSDDPRCRPNAEKE